MKGALLRLWAIVRKEFMQLRRDRLTIGMIVGIPSLQLLLFGFAINMDVRHLDAAVWDAANTAASRRWVAALAHTQVVALRARVTSAQELDVLMREGRIGVAIVLPHDFDRRLAQATEPAAQLVVDGSDPSVANAAAQLAAIPTGTNDPPMRVQVMRRYNPNRQSAINTVPALIGVILTMTMVLFTAVAIVRERERGNLELLITTPVRPIELVVGKVLPFVGIGLLQVTVVLALGILVFDLPVRGSWLDLYAAALIYIVAALALGVLVSTLGKSQFQAMQLAFFTFLPQILLSGFMFPFAGMPRAVQTLAEFLPLTHFVRLSRGIILRSASLGELWPDAAALIGFALVTLGIATVRFRKRLD